MKTMPFPNLQEYTQNAMSAAKELETINAGLIEKMTGSQMELANAAVEIGTRYVQSVSEVKGYQEMMAEQTKLVTEYNEKLIEVARGTADAVSEAREAYQAWFEKGLTTMTPITEFNIPGLKPTPKKTTRKAA